MNIYVRKVQASDTEAITELSVQLGYQATNGDIRYRLAEILTDKSYCVYVAEVDEKIAGWIQGCYSLRVESDSFVEIGGLVIHENYRRMGIGKILVETVMEWSASKKCKKIRVRSNVKRTPAHEFYKNLGFVESKEQKVFSKSIG